MLLFEVHTRFSLKAYRNGIIKTLNLFPISWFIITTFVFAWLVSNIFYALRFWDERSFARSVVLFVALSVLCVVPIASFLSANREYKKKLMRVYGTTSAALNFSFFEKHFTIQGPLRKLNINYSDTTYVAETRKYFHFVLDGGTSLYSIKKSDISIDVDTARKLFQQVHKELSE